MTRVLLALTATGGGLYGWATDNAALLLLAFFAFLVLLWLEAHDTRRWERP